MLGLFRATEAAATRGTPTPGGTAPGAQSPVSAKAKAPCCQARPGLRASRGGPLDHHSVRICPFVSRCRGRGSAFRLKPGHSRLPFNLVVSFLMTLCSDFGVFGSTLPPSAPSHHPARPMQHEPTSLRWKHKWKRDECVSDLREPATLKAA